MKKCVLVVFMGMVLAMNIYGIVDRFASNDECNCIEESTIAIHME